MSSGVRRIEAVTGHAALQWMNDRNNLLDNAAQILKTTPQQLPQRLQALMDERKKLEQDIANLRRQLMSGANSNDNTETINGIMFVHQVVNDVPAKDLKSLVDHMKKKIGSGIAVIISIEASKVALVAGVTDDLTSKVSAVDLARAAADMIGGKGGGRPDLAQAGGTDISKIDDAIAEIKKYIQSNS